MKQIIDKWKKRLNFSSQENRAYQLLLDDAKVNIYCHMTDDLDSCGGGGWTMVMKMDGSKQTFNYNSELWINTDDFNPQGGETGFDLNETKLPTYWNTSFSKICLGMKLGDLLRFTVIKKEASSLYSLIADGQYRETSLGRDTWKSLIGSDASLQLNCNTEGFNAVVKDQLSKARIGIIANNQNDCKSCDSRIGFGTGGSPDHSNTCGNTAKHGGDNGDKHIKALGYILTLFHYQYQLWSNKESLNLSEGEIGFHSEENKLPSYRKTSISKICIDIKTDEQIRFNASLQLNYNKEGFNAKSPSAQSSNTRIGFLGNNKDYCRNCDSRIGFSTENPVVNTTLVVTE
ncbi:hypothetical protein pdam_00003830 [Pocillopora damicornis]|uniref:Fibrinogen C-terminal domain-containing protein n=1 Tax=Pocillopora damicornis TaxID=46731 RepID=A0A3M6T4J0_POCDA|nr:hypothetical protein pdam_00003830 [Pocillopora damicornis]